MTASREQQRSRTLRWLAKLGAILVFGALVAAWWGWMLFESFAMGMGATGGSARQDDLRFAFGVLGTVWVLGGLLAVLVAGRLRTVVLVSSLVSLGLGAVALARPLLWPMMGGMVDANEERREAANLARVESMCAFHIPADEHGTSHHFVWEGGRLIELKLWDTVVQSNPVAEREGQTLRFWRHQSDYGDLAEERMRRATEAVDASGRRGLEGYEVVMVDKPTQDYRAALSEAQRTYNRH